MIKLVLTDNNSLDRQPLGPIAVQVVPLLQITAPFLGGHPADYMVPKEHIALQPATPVVDQALPFAHKVAPWVGGHPLIVIGP